MIKYRYPAPWEETTMGKVVHLNFRQRRKNCRRQRMRSILLSGFESRSWSLSHKLSIADIARRLQIPASSAALHIRELQEANLGAASRCSRGQGLCRLTVYKGDGQDHRHPADRDERETSKDTLERGDADRRLHGLSGKETLWHRRCGWRSPARMTRRDLFLPSASWQDV